MIGKLLPVLFLLSAFAHADTAIFAGGCFWCEEAAFRGVAGVTQVISGYTGGTKDNPTYHEVSAGGTGHSEAVQVTYDPKVITYAQLLDRFWKNEDPLDPDGQFCDKGDQYKAVIFYLTPEQKALAEASKKKWIDSKKFGAQPITTAVRAATKFYPAEDYHQDYAHKNPVRYKFYRYRCGRDKVLKERWGAAGH